MSSALQVRKLGGYTRQSNFSCILLISITKSIPGFLVEFLKLQHRPKSLLAIFDRFGTVLNSWISVPIWRCADLREDLTDWMPDSVIFKD